MGLAGRAVPRPSPSVGPGAETPFDDIYQDYRRFCEENEYHAKGKQAFGKELRRYPHISKSRTTTRPKTTVYLNVRLQDQLPETRIARRR